MIYAISVAQPGDVRFIKFGKARNPHSRLRELQTGNPLRLQIYAEVDWPDECERALHKRFSHKRVCGEWFTVDDEINEFMNLMVYEPDRALEALGPVRAEGVTEGKQWERLLRSMNEFHQACYDKTGERAAADPLPEEGRKKKQRWSRESYNAYMRECMRRKRAGV